MLWLTVRRSPDAVHSLGEGVARRAPHTWQRSIRRFAGVATVLVATLAVGVAPAYATTSGGIALYISAPFVQGSAVTGAGTFTETFNDRREGSLLTSEGRSGWVCPPSIEAGAITASPDRTTINGCFISAAGIYGGASSTSSAPFNGGDGSDYPGVPFYNRLAEPERSFTIDFGGSPVKYVGFWWSAGNPGNVVTFYDSTGEIASVNTSELSAADKLGAGPPTPDSSWPAGNGYVTSIGGDEYPKGQYFGNPRFATATTPSPTADSGFQFVYLNLFLTGDAAATSVKFSGPGFEIDNLTTSTLEQTPATSLVFIKGVLGKTVTFRDGAPFDAGTPSASGTMVPQTANGPTNLSANGYSREGYLFTGWNTAADGTGDPYGPGGSYDFATDLVLYAQWDVAPSVVEGDSESATSSKSSGEPLASSPGQLAATGADSSLGLLLAMVAVAMGAVGGVLSLVAPRRGNRSA